MRKQYRILLVILLAAIVGAFAWQVLRPREPVYKGKALSYWLQGYIQPRPGGSVTEAQADEAVRQTGTNGIPTLLKLLCAEDSPLRLKVIALVQRQHFIVIHHTPAVLRSLQAVEGFKRLGANAREAVPILIEMHDRNNSANSQPLCAYALGAIGPAARQAGPSLLRGVVGTNLTARFAHIQALVQIHADPALVVPVLAKCLGDGDPATEFAAAHALGEFGADAKAAVPELLALLSNPSPQLGNEAAYALKKIDPEAAAKAGVK